MIRVLIAEDDPQCFQQMEQFIRDYSSETGRAFRITHYDNGEDLVEQYRPEFDLLLLDVDMPFVDGMTAAGHIRKMDPEVVIVFVTNLAHVSGVRDGCAVVQGDKLLISRGRRALFLDTLADYVGGARL